MKISLEEFESKPENKKYKTVGELVEALEKFPKDTHIVSVGWDIGGYDTSSHNWASVEENIFSPKWTGITILHQEDKAYSSLSYEDYQKYMEGEG